MTQKVKYNSIGASYNETRCADVYIAKRLLSYLAPSKEKLYVDIGCGTGNYTIALHKMGLNFIGIDPSTRMLKKARSKCDSINWKIGTAENNSLEDNSIDGAIATLTIHHWTNLQRAFQNINTNLKPNSLFVIFTSTPNQMKGYWLNHYFPKMLEDSIKQMPSYETLQTNLEKAGFKIEAVENYFVKQDLQDLFLYAGKHRPELYLNPLVINGISSFLNFSNKDEVQQGLKKLQDDITSGYINQIINNYSNKTGDYLFVKAKNNNY
jgi:ubiquinone/menaquinone biosynthesis C-methylase UbiE